MSTLHPLHAEAKDYLESLAKSGFKPTYALSGVKEARDLSYKSAVSYVVQYDGTRTEMFVPSQDNSDGIAVYVYNPINQKTDATILIYFHGGGMVTGSRANSDSFCKIISMKTNCIVVNVEYRLAPEHKFPAGIDDACTVTRWVLNNKTAIGGSLKSKIGVGGDSSGGHLAASTAHDVPGLSFQILVYPHLLARGDRSLPSYKEYAEGPLLDLKLIDWFEERQADKSDWNDPRLAVLSRSELSKLPPAIFIVAQCDPIRDDSYEYSKKLTSAGIYNELHLFEGAIHAFFSKPNVFVELCEKAYNLVAQFIEKFS